MPAMPLTTEQLRKHFAQAAKHVAETEAHVARQTANRQRATLKDQLREEVLEKHRELIRSSLQESAK
jgi:hypothetical protein